MVEIKKKIYSIGITDWELRSFHGQELSIHRGTSYNCYVVMDEKTVLVDTVWDLYKEEFADKLDREVGLDKIDMIVINHSEPDHGGTLEYLLERMPSRNVPIYCTKNGAEAIKKQFNRDDYNFRIVKTGDTVNIGEYDLVFVEMQMLHWPDSMLTYVKGAATVFSNDAFGQHYAGLSLFNDEVDSCELFEEALKYYANILTPFSPLIKKKIDEIRGLNLPIEMIAPSHGVIWRTNPEQIIDKYYEWAHDYNEGHAVIIYETMYDATKKMAHAIAEGLQAKGVKYKIFDVAKTDKSDIITEVFKAKAVIVGSCTVNNTYMRDTAGLLNQIKGLKLKGKIGAGFGSYGWSGEAPKLINAALQSSGIKTPFEHLSFKFMPSEAETEQCREFGKKLAEVMLEG